MKILVFSDTHLTDAFDKKKFRFLEKIISQVDQVIINGDFWDSFITPFDSFVKSPWKNLFPLLKDKKTIYVYGNHDRSKLSDERVNLFSVLQTEEYELPLGSATYVFEHGHSSFEFTNGKMRFHPRVLRTMTIWSTYAEWLFTKLWGRSTRFFGSFLNKRLKKKTKNFNGHIGIFGHTHYAELDKNNKFINTGYIQHGLAQYLIIENNGASVKEEKYS